MSKNGRKKPVYLSGKDRVAVLDWLRANWQRIEKERPTRGMAAAWCGAAIGFAELNAHHVNSVAKAASLEWPIPLIDPAIKAARALAGRRRRGDLADGVDRVRRLSRIVRDLFLTLGEPVPDDLGALCDGRSVDSDAS